VKRINRCPTGQCSRSLAAPADFSSPAWHENILKEREQSLREGKDKFVDWDQTKKDIWDSVS